MSETPNTTTRPAAHPEAARKAPASTAPTAQPHAAGSHAADSHDVIRVHGARENNLKDASRSPSAG